MQQPQKKTVIRTEAPEKMPIIIEAIYDGADFRRTVYAYEEEKKMPYISSIERVGIEKGIQQGIQQGVQQGVQQGMLQRSREAVIEILETRFETVPHSVISAVEKTDDTSVLKTLFHDAITVKSINEFIKILNTITV